MPNRSTFTNPKVIVIIPRGGFVKRLALSVLCVLAFGFSAFASEATDTSAMGGSAVGTSAMYDRETDPRTDPRTDRDSERETERSDMSVPEGQRDIANAQQRGKGVNYLEVQDAVVSKLLPDDTQGRPHQKWVVSLANGRSLLSVYNADMGERIPLKVGDTVSMGGQYIWDRSGGLIHWLHHDPKGRRPDGWVELNGVVYGK